MSASGTVPGDERLDATTGLRADVSAGVCHTGRSPSPAEPFRGSLGEAPLLTIRRLPAFAQWHARDVAVTLRDAGAADADFLTEMLVAAAFWRPQDRGDINEVMGDPELAHYVARWPSSGDRGVVAEDDTHQPVGAAWFRFFPEQHPGYGFVDATVPELSMGMVSSQRGHGVGGRLLAALVDAARSDEVAGLSLSVEPDNYARWLYERAGFQQVGHVEGALTMILHL